MLQCYDSCINCAFFYESQDRYAMNKSRNDSTKGTVTMKKSAAYSTRLPTLLIGVALITLWLTSTAQAQVKQKAQTSAQGEVSTASADALPSAFPEERESRAEGFMTPLGFKVNFSGYTQVRYQRIEDDESLTQFVGRNDGFGMSNARLIFDVQKDELAAYFSIEGSRDRRRPNNRADGDVRTMMLDAFLTYELSPKLRLHLGRFKPAYDANELESTADLLFIDRALESRGVLGVEGLNVAGLSLTRQAGAQLDGVVPFSPKKTLRLKYFISVTNGNNGERPLNDNDALSYTGRLEFVGRMSSKVVFVIGGGAYYNEITEGELPDLISETRVGFTADARLHLYGLKLRGQWMRQETDYIDIEAEPKRIAEGFHAIVGYDLGRLAPSLKGIMPAYRFAQYDPTKSAVSTDPTLSSTLIRDQVTHHTIGGNVFFQKRPSKRPLKLQLNYTLAQEQAKRATDNDRLDVMLQMMF